MSEPAPAMRKPPWESALYEAVRKHEEQIKELKGERAKLLARVADLHERVENWRIRYETLRRERDELLRRLGEQRGKG